METVKLNTLTKDTTIKRVVRLLTNDKINIKEAASYLAMFDYCTCINVDKDIVNNNMLKTANQYVTLEKDALIKKLNKTIAKHKYINSINEFKSITESIDAYIKSVIPQCNNTEDFIRYIINFHNDTDSKKPEPEDVKFRKRVSTLDNGISRWLEPYKLMFLADTEQIESVISKLKITYKYSNYTATANAIADGIVDSNLKHIVTIKKEEEKMAEIKEEPVVDNTKELLFQALKEATDVTIDLLRMVNDVYGDNTPYSINRIGPDDVEFYMIEVQDNAESVSDMDIIFGVSSPETEEPVKEEPAVQVTVTPNPLFDTDKAKCPTEEQVAKATTSVMKDDTPAVVVKEIISDADMEMEIAMDMLAEDKLEQSTPVKPIKEEPKIDSAESALEVLIAQYGANAINAIMNIKIGNTPIKEEPKVDVTDEAKKIFDDYFGADNIATKNLTWLKRDIVNKASKAQRGAVKDCIAFINIYMTERAITTLIFKKWRRDVEFTPVVDKTCKLVINYLCANKVLTPYYKTNKKAPENLVGFTLRPEIMAEFYLKDNDGLLYQSLDIKPIYYILTKDSIIRRDTGVAMPISDKYISALAGMNYVNVVTMPANKKAM